MTLDRLGILLKKAKVILQEEGVIPFIKRAFSFFRTFLFNYKTCYIYENTLDGPRFTPKTQDVNLKILSTPQELDELIANGFDLSYQDINDLKKKISQGAIPFCAFVKQDLAHITWVALAEESKREIDPFPFKIDWQNEACSGLSGTTPNYRRMGIYSYVYSEIFRFLKEKRRSKDKFRIDKDNIASHNALVKLGSEIYAEGRTLKVLWRKFYKERPLGKLKNTKQ